MKRCLLIGLAAMIVSASAVHSEWIHSGPRNYGLPMYVPLTIDINEDGITDVSLSFTFYITMDVPTSGGSGFITGSTSGNFVLSDGGYAVPILILGQDPEVALPNGTWTKGSFSIGSYSVNFLDGTWSGWQGPWADVDLGYFVMLFRDSANQLRTAWIRLLVPDDQLMPSAIVMDWFYESEPLPEPGGSEMVVLLSQDAVRTSFSDVHKGLQYILEYSTNLLDGVWTTSNVFTAQSNTLVVTNSVSSESVFWRLKRTP